jgi:hypothetical protein
MTGQLELNSRAELCRKLAEIEPANRILWMAEAENWLRLSQDKLRDGAGEKAKFGTRAGVLGRSAIFFGILA